MASVTDRKRNLSLLTIFAVVLMDMLGVGLVIPILSPMILENHQHIIPFAPGTDHADLRAIILGVLIACFPLFQFFGAPMLGGWADRYGRKRILIIALLGTVCGYLLTAWGIVAAHLTLLFVARALDGFTGGNISIAYSVISDLSNRHSKAKNFGLIGIAFGIGFILGPFVGGKLSNPELVSWFSYETPFLLAAGLAVLNTIFVAFFLPETKDGALVRRPGGLRQGMRNIVAAFRHPQLSVLFWVIFLLSSGFNFFTQFFQVYLIEQFDFGPEDVGNLFAYIGGWAILAQGGLQRWLCRYYKPYHILRVSAFTLGIFLPALLLPRQAQALYYLIPLVSVSQGLKQPNITALISNQAQPEEQGRTLGIMQSMQSMALIFPPLVSGFLHAFMIELPILMAGAFTLAGWLVLIFRFGSHRSKNHP